jgi:hypothetical protein
MNNLYIIEVNELHPSSYQGTDPADALMRQLVTRLWQGAEHLSERENGR